MGANNLEKLVTEFESQTEEVKKNLLSAVEIVSKGKILGNELETKIKTSLSELNNEYDSIKQQVEDLIGDELIPDEIIPARQFIDIVSENEKKLYKNKLLQAENILKTFLQIRSAIDGYANALKPIQDEVKKQLNKRADNKLDDEETLQAAKKPELLVNAITMGDINSGEGLNLLNQIGEVYPPLVMAGAAAKQYYIDSSVDNAVANAPNEEKATTIEAKTENTHVREEVVKKEEKSVEEVEEPAEESTEEMGETLKDNDEEITGGVIKAINNPKRGEPNASSFKKDFKKFPSSSAARRILPILTNFGILTLNQIYQLGVCADVINVEQNNVKEIFEATIESMVGKGWLAKFEIEEEIYAYSLSDFVYRTLISKESIRSGIGEKWLLPLGAYDFKTNKVMSREKVINAYENNKYLVYYLISVRKSVDKNNFAKIMSSVKWDGNHYNIAVISNSEIVNTKLLIDYSKIADLNINDFLWIQAQDENLDELIVGDAVNTVYVLENNSVKAYEPIGGKINLLTEENNEDNQRVKVNNADETVGEAIEETLTEKPQAEDTATKEPSIEEKKSSKESVEEKTPAEEPSTESVSVEENVNISLEDEMKTLTNVHDAMNDSDLYKYALDMLNPEEVASSSIEQVSNATLLMKAASMEEGNNQCNDLYKKLIFATGNPIGETNYSYTPMSEVFSYDQPDALLLSAQMLAMIIPSMAYDYALRESSNRFLENFDTLFPNCNCIKGLFNQLNRIWNISPNGYTPSIIALLGNDQENQKFANDLKTQARAKLTVPSVTTRMKTLPAMYYSCFGAHSEFYACMDIIANNQTDDVDVVENVLEEFCDVVDGQYNINSTKTEEFLAQKWDEVNPGNNFTLEYDAKPKVLRHFYNRINLMKTWVEHTESLGGKTIDISKLKTLRSEIIEESENAINHFSDIDMKNRAVLYMTITNIRRYLSGEKMEFQYDKALYTGIISLDDDFLPIIDNTTAGIKYCEPWRSVIKYIEADKRTKEEVIENVNDRESIIFDNLNQLEKLGKKLSDDSEEFIVSDSRLKQAIASADASTMKFKERLELAYTYDQITENDKETLAAIMEQQKQRFYAIKDFGCWRQFLDGLERQVLESALKGKRRLREKIQDRLKEDPKSTILIEADKLLNRDANLAIAEEYLNRYDAGEKEISSEMKDLEAPANDFTDFLSDEVYTPIYNFCKQKSSGALKNVGWSFVSGKLPADWTVRLRDDSRQLIEAWPSRRGANENRILTIFKKIGFQVNGINTIRGSEEMFRLELKPTPRSKADYPHPIAAFGTQMKRNMNVIVLYGNHTPSQIVETVSKIDSKGFSFVLLDRPLDQATRRRIGELSHQKSGQNPFLLIDWVLIMYLAMQDSARRLPILLACTLPYTTYQPFVRDGGPTADEMFCGRTKELNTIMDKNGASVVYGGRQLGKTALLERAESRCHRPEDQEYAVFCSIIHKKTEKEVAGHIIDEINKKTGFCLKSVNTLKDMCSQIETLFRTHKVSYFLLLLDECDDFLGAIADDSYCQLQDLINLKRSTKNSFKFVLAGLHNVCRAKNSTERNGVFGQLGEPLCVKPLQPSEALQLLSRPLSYLGFQIDPYPQLKTILTKTNYYPGILQFFGYKLLETLTDQYSRYYSAANGNPPFTLTEKQLGAVLNSTDLNNSIKDKFRWSLELDQRYFMMARCITMLYYFEPEDHTGNWKGFSISQIKGMADEYEIHCLSDMSEHDYKNLLDEMVDMGILSRTEGEAYRLRRSSFIGIIGADMDSLDAEIKENNKEESIL